MAVFEVKEISEKQTFCRAYHLPKRQIKEAQAQIKETLLVFSSFLDFCAYDKLSHKLRYKP